MVVVVGAQHVGGVAALEFDLEPVGFLAAVIHGIEVAEGPVGSGLHTGRCHEGDQACQAKARRNQTHVVFHISGWLGIGFRRARLR